MIYLAKYGAAYTFEFPVVKAGAIDFAVSGDWTPATGDTKICKDGGNVTNTSNNPAAVGGTGSRLWKLTLTATEMQAARVAIQIVDAAIEDQAIIIATYGHASAQHAFDLDKALSFSGSYVKADLQEWRSSVPAALSSTFIQAHVRSIVNNAIGPPTFSAGAIDAAAIAPNAIGASELAADAANEIADAVLRRATADVEAGWTEDDRTLYGVIAALMHKHQRDGSAITLYKSNDTDVLVTIPISTDSALDPIAQIDPP